MPVPIRTISPSVAAVADFDREVVRSMRMLSRHPQSVFVGQSVRYDGSRIYTTLDGVPMEKRREHPVIEDHQLGYCIGLAMRGMLPICIYPRIDFMLLAVNQLVNHLDKLPALWGLTPKVIIRTAVGRKQPLNAGPQHTNNHTGAFQRMLDTVRVVELTEAWGVYDAYSYALECEGSTLFVENPGG